MKNSFLKLKNLLKNLPKNKGYTLLFAVLISSVVLGVTLSILGISRKEFILATSARESQYAFYAADSGLECASYVDQQGVFQSAGGNVTFTCGSGGTVEGYIASDQGQDPSQFTATTTFSVRTGAQECADVSVTKHYTIGGPPEAPTTDVAGTLIVSRGYNIGWNPSQGNCSKTDPRKVERKLLLFR